MLKKILRLLGASEPKSKHPDQLTKEQLRPYLPAEPTILEAGAHIGRDTVEMSKLWPKGTIHAFEPLPDLFAKLKAATRSCPNVLCHDTALSDRSGTLEFNVSGGKSDASSSILSPKQHLEQHPDVSFERKISVKATTIAEWAHANGVDRVDFLWLDLQGYELFALKAAGDILPTVQAIYSEVYLKESYQGVPLYPELKEWLAGKGFRVEWEGLPWPDSGNVLFVRR